MALPETPLTRGEQYLAKAAGEDTALPNVPLTRIEQYLAKIAGQDVAIPNVPLTRMEQYLAYIAENGGGGGGGGVQDYSTTLVVEPDGSSATLYAFFDGLWLSEMEPNLEKGARIHITPTESIPMELYLYMTAKDGNTIYMATVISLGTEQTPRILLFRSEERVEGAYFTAKLSMG